jgi:hypothetical protein
MITFDAIASATKGDAKSERAHSNSVDSVPENSLLRFDLSERSFSTRSPGIHAIEFGAFDIQL